MEATSSSWGRFRVLFAVSSIAAATHLWRHSLSTFQVFMFADKELRYTQEIHSLVLAFYNVPAGAAACIGGIFFRTDSCALQALLAVFVEWVGQLIMALTISLHFPRFLLYVGAVLGGTGGGLTVILQRTILSAVFCHREIIAATAISVAFSAAAKVIGVFGPALVTLMTLEYRLSLFFFVGMNFISVLIALKLTLVWPSIRFEELQSPEVCQNPLTFSYAASTLCTSPLVDTEDRRCPKLEKLSETVPEEDGLVICNQRRDSNADVKSDTESSVPSHVQSSNPLTDNAPEKRTSTETEVQECYTHNYVQKKVKRVKLASNDDILQGFDSLPADESVNFGEMQSAICEESPRCCKTTTNLDCCSEVFLNTHSSLTMSPAVCCWRKRGISFPQRAHFALRHPLSSSSSRAAWESEEWPFLLPQVDIPVAFPSAWAISRSFLVPPVFDDGRRQPLDCSQRQHSLLYLARHLSCNFWILVTIHAFTLSFVHCFTSFSTDVFFTSLHTTVTTSAALSVIPTFIAVLAAPPVALFLDRRGGGITLAAAANAAGVAVLAGATVMLQRYGNSGFSLSFAVTLAVVMGLLECLTPTILLSKIAHPASVSAISAFGLAFSIVEATTAVSASAATAVFGCLRTSTGSYKVSLDFALVLAFLAFVQLLGLQFKEKIYPSGLDRPVDGSA